ncbi:MAG: tetratricopeptide repeat protein, partial [Bacteroidales bacterium]|nr:tetratricopeptide repeat protein [Bacteroidales bacterium]
MKRTFLILFALIIAASPLYAQQKNESKPNKATAEQRSLNRSGNKQYKKGAYAESEAMYRKALRQDSSYYRSLYNLGNSLYQQKNYSEAAKQFDKVASNATLDKKDRSRAYHNLGNSHLQQGLQQKQGGAQDGGRQLFQQAVNDYQQALRLDPKNQDTKYNLSYAKKMLLQAQQNQQNNQNDQNKQQKQQ